MDFSQIKPEELQPSQWDSAVQEKHQQVLAERNKALPAQSGKKSGKDPNQNDFRVVDRSYLQKNFKAQAEAAQKLIEDVIETFELNSEQERAFRIVANHAVRVQASSTAPQNSSLYSGTFLCLYSNVDAMF